MESKYADILLHNKVRWLSRGDVLKRFASLFPEIKAFVLEKGDHYPELTDDQWIQNFYFMVDVTSHLNRLNQVKFSPFKIDIGSFEIQLLDLKNKEIWCSKFEHFCVKLEILYKKKCDLSSQQKWSALNDQEKEDMIIFNAWNSIHDSYDQMKKLAFAVLSLFGSTYICEKSVSSMNIIKSKLRSRLTDENLK
ncbi:uncharacterized protein TNCV_763971 [Trichonephila clavipes]|nr:uncharacterized protein TNCV_763971 [Trichonephila clavipes]